MKQTVDFDDFVQAFANHGRQTQFSDAALRVLYDHLENEDPDYELDVVALCCEYCEEDTADLAERLGVDTEDMDADEILATVLDRLGDLTSVVGAISVVNGGDRILYLEY